MREFKDPSEIDENVGSPRPTPPDSSWELLEAQASPHESFGELQTPRRRDGGTPREASDRARPISGGAEREAREREARDAVAGAYEEVEYDTRSRAPVSWEAIAERTAPNRIDLADDVSGIQLTPTHDGYLDVVIHGDTRGTQADVDGLRFDFTRDQLGRMVEESPAWGHRPVRLMSCSTGAGDLARDLSERLGVPVYAPTDVHNVRADGKAFVDPAGEWRRFEPSPHSVKARRDQVDGIRESTTYSAPSEPGDRESYRLAEAPPPGKMWQTQSESNEAIVALHGWW